MKYILLVFTLGVFSCNRGSNKKQIKSLDNNVLFEINTKNDTLSFRDEEGEIIFFN